MHPAWLLLIGYFCGTIPFAVIVAGFYKVDILKAGSGNPGATNVFRTIGWKPGIVVFLLDLVKGLVPPLLARHVFHVDEEWIFFAGVASVIGHTLSPFIGFKGGKGIATGFGAYLGSMPLIAAIAFSAFLITLFIWRYISLASIIACVAVFVLCLIYQVPLSILITSTLLLGFIVYKHIPNMKRLKEGTESKFSIKGKST